MGKASSRVGQAHNQTNGYREMKTDQTQQIRRLLQGLIIRCLVWLLVHVRWDWWPVCSVSGQHRRELDWTVCSSLRPLIFVRDLISTMLIGQLLNQRIDFASCGCDVQSGILRIWWILESESEGAICFCKTTIDFPWRIAQAKATVVECSVSSNLKFCPICASAYQGHEMQPICFF